MYRDGREEKTSNIKGIVEREVLDGLLPLVSFWTGTRPAAQAVGSFCIGWPLGPV